MTEIATNVLDVDILERIRNNIITAMQQVQLHIDSDYKLSKVKEDRTIFKIELMRSGLSITQIRNTLKAKFDYMPEFKPSAAFIELNFKKEHDYRYELSNRK